jgi:hypothetical protein
LDFGPACRSPQFGDGNLRFAYLETISSAQPEIHLFGVTVLVGKKFFAAKCRL